MSCVLEWRADPSRAFNAALRRLALNHIQKVDYPAVKYLKMDYKKIRGFKISNLYIVLREEMHNLKASHQFVSNDTNLAAHPSPLLSPKANA